MYRLLKWLLQFFRLCLIAAVLYGHGLLVWQVIQFWPLGVTTLEWRQPATASSSEGLGVTDLTQHTQRSLRKHQQ